MIRQLEGSVSLLWLQAKVIYRRCLHCHKPLSRETPQCTLIGRQGGRHKLSTVVLVTCVGLPFSRAGGGFWPPTQKNNARTPSRETFDSKTSVRPSFLMVSNSSHHWIVSVMRMQLGALNQSTITVVLHTFLWRIWAIHIARKEVNSRTFRPHT